MIDDIALKICILLYIMVDMPSRDDEVASMYVVWIEYVIFDMFVSLTLWFGIGVRYLIIWTRFDPHRMVIEVVVYP